jgi:uncharacterized caspase-like protein
MATKMMKRALLVGIDDYSNMTPLLGCVNDVNALEPLLSRNEDKSPNFKCQVRTPTRSQRIDRRSLIADIDALLAPGSDVALFYFAGHAKKKHSDVAIALQDDDRPETGISLSDILASVQVSSVPEVLIILDCCYAGRAGISSQLGSSAAVLRSGVSILSATRGDARAAETWGLRGAFSTYLCAALDSGATDVLGRVTIASVFAYLSESFGPWEQRPTFKSNVDRLHELRQCSPWVPMEDLRLLPEIFRESDSLLQLDSSYEPSLEPIDPVREAIFATLQRYRAAKLAEPIGAEHMYFAALEGKECRLTPLGKHYWWMAKQDLL